MNWEMAALIGLLAWIVAAFLLGVWFGRTVRLGDGEYVGDSDEWKTVEENYWSRDGAELARSISDGWERRGECQRTS